MPRALHKITGIGRPAGEGEPTRLTACGLSLKLNRCRAKWKAVTCGKCLHLAPVEVRRARGVEPPGPPPAGHRDRAAYIDGVLATIPDDLPDGAYFAMLAEAGIEPDELVEDEEDPRAL